MEKHRTIAGYLVLGWGVLILLFGVLLTQHMAGNVFAVGGEGALMGWLGVSFGLLIILLALMFIAGGFGFAKGRPGARPLMWIAAVISLLSIPIGTAIGAYSIWVLVKKA